MVNIRDTVYFFLRCQCHHAAVSLVEQQLLVTRKAKAGGGVTVILNTNSYADGASLSLQKSHLRSQIISSRRARQTANHVVGKLMAIITSFTATNNIATPSINHQQQQQQQLHHKIISS
eukprot:scaffold7006_cov174-Skeletonema_marinoi.AAC.42